MADRLFRGFRVVDTTGDLRLNAEEAGKWLDALVAGSVMKDESAANLKAQFI